jgi:hypothetical protein
MVVAVMAFGLPLVVGADARTDRLVDLLRTSGNYRVRVQSAQSLGRIRDPETVVPLMEALGDEHPAVRAAAAQALGRIGAAEAIPALRRLAGDTTQPQEVIDQADRAVSQIQQIAATSTEPAAGAPADGSIRFYIGVGEMGNTTGVRPGELETTLAALIKTELEQSGGVQLAPDGETPSAAGKVIKAHGWTGYFIQGSVVRLEEVEGQVHALISIMVLSNPGRDLRMMLHGRASAGMPAGQKIAPTQVKGLQDYALKASVKGAIQRLAEQLRSGP